MHAGIHIEMDILSSLVCIMLFYQQRRHKVFDFLGTTAFNSLLWASVGVMMLDIVSWSMMGGLIPHADMALMIVQTMYYAVQALLPLLFLWYCVNTSGRRVAGIWLGLITVPLVITWVAVAVNLFTGFAFYVKDGIIVRAEGFLASIFSAMIYLVDVLILSLYFYIRSRSETQERRRISFHVMICVVICFVGSAACVFINYISPWHVFVAALLYLYMQLHSYREHSLDAQVSTDSLTGLKNHAVYSHIKEEMGERLQKDPQHRFAVAVMDVNDLKHINDVYGHKVGDALLIAAARLMCNVFAHSPVCRIGGDEFVAILEKGDYENREALCESFAEQMKTTVFSAEGKELPVTVALGIAAYVPEYCSAFEDVFHAADEAMYVNKEQLKKNKKAAL